MKRFLLIFCVACLLCICHAQAETAWVTQDLRVRHGTQVACLFTADQTAEVYLTTPQGQALRTLDVSMNGTSGQVLVDTSLLDVSAYCLYLVSGGQSTPLNLTVTEPFPELISCDGAETPSDPFPVTVQANLPGTVCILNGTQIIMEAKVSAGTNELSVPVRGMESGSHTVLVYLQAASGEQSEPWEIVIRVPEPEPTHPAQDQTRLSPEELTGNHCDHDVCYWTLPMDFQDEEAVWKVLTSPMTVLSGDERKQYKVRLKPDASCKDYVGEVTYASQGVHILEAGDDWTLIEAYSSSVEGSSVHVYASHFTGYVETRLLKEIPVSQEVGLVIDKLQQRLYVYQNGHLISTLLCSTGYARQDTPFHETPAGEFLAISHTGGFWSGNLFCDLAIRINDGILLHEVPCTITTEEDGTETRHYERCEYYLGEKASHGCVRIQRETGTGGVNMKWLWEHLPRSGVRAKVLIWEDSGRILVPASDDYPLYYNPDNGRQYHSDPYCPLVHTRFHPLTAFRYDELDSEPYAKLTRCPGCAPQLRQSEIETMNKKNRSHAYSSSESE